MDLQPNKTDGIHLPITNTRISASEWNQLVGSCMAFITEAGLTPDASDNEQFLNAFKTIAAGLGSIGANTNLSNLTATGEARFTTKANTDLSNVSATGKATAIGWGMPDYTAGISFSNNTNYAAPKNGVAMCVVNLGDYNSLSDTRIYINNNEVFFIAGTSSGAVRNLIYIPVSKGDIIKIYMKSTTTSSLKFYPFKGVN